MNKSSSKTWDSKLFENFRSSKPHIILLIYGIILTTLLALSPLRPYIIGKLVGDYVRYLMKNLYFMEHYWLLAF